MIPDAHNSLSGIRPVLFEVGTYAVSTYTFFMALGVLVAFAVYGLCSDRTATNRREGWTIVMAALLFGSMGAKLMGVLLNTSPLESFEFVKVLYGGRSILGGLVGGWVGVKLAKRMLGIQTRHGNAIAPAVAFGIVAGRIGCFLGSCCYGKATLTGFGMDFGDGIQRHPTQLYEAAFTLVLGLLLLVKRQGNPAPGALFREFVVWYLSFRFLIEFIRVEQPVAFGLTFYQWFSVVCIGVVLGPMIWRRVNAERAPIASGTV